MGKLITITEMAAILTERKIAEVNQTEISQWLQQFELLDLDGMSLPQHAKCFVKYRFFTTDIKPRKSLYEIMITEHGQKHIIECFMKKLHLLNTHYITPA